MKIVINIGHPAQVHLFRNFIKAMKDKGKDVIVTAIDKELVKYLLDYYNIDYFIIGKYPKKLVSKMAYLPYFNLNVLKISMNFKPDIFIGALLSHVSKMLGKNCIVFDDTEHVNLQHRFCIPFIDAILTPSYFKKDLGRKQIRYNGYHELAYLHPNYFTPNPAVLDEMELSKDDNIFLIRFAAFNASHDTKSENFKKEYVLPLIKKLEKEGEIIISSEIKLDKNLRKYQYKLSPEKYHDVLYYSKMYIGEGSTTAEEAAILGVPALHFERLNIDGKACGITSFIGVLDELQNKYGLLYSYYNENELLVKVDEILANIDTIKREWEKKRKKILKDKIDVTAFMIWFIENYPEGVKQMKETPEIQHKFRSTSKDGV